MGHFNRVAVMTGPGTVIGDGKEIPTPEAVASNMKKIKSTERTKEFPNAVAAYGPMLDAFGPKKEAGAGGEGMKTSSS
jgi:hypothetical protein